MIKVKVHVNTNTTFEKEFPDNTSSEEMAKTIRELVIEKVDWSWEREE